MAKTQPRDIDEYIAACASSVRPVLKRIRSTIRAAAPQAAEVISYGIPAFRERRILVYFAAFKGHIGFYPPVRGDARLDAAMASYRGPKGNLRFPLDAPIPYGLIARIVRLRVRQDRAKSGKARKRSR